MHRNQPDPAPPTGVYPWKCHGWPRDRIETMMHMISRIRMISHLSCLSCASLLKTFFLSKQTACTFCRPGRVSEWTERVGKLLADRADSA